MERANPATLYDAAMQAKDDPPYLRRDYVALHALLLDTQGNRFAQKALRGNLSIEDLAIAQHSCEHPLVHGGTPRKLWLRNTFNYRNYWRHDQAKDMSDLGGLMDISPLEEITRTWNACVISATILGTYMTSFVYHETESLLAASAAALTSVLLGHAWTMTAVDSARKVAQTHVEEQGRAILDALEPKVNYQDKSHGAKSESQTNSDDSTIGWRPSDPNAWKNTST